MAIDFNAADEQKAPQGDAIPEDSVVVVVAEIRPPKEGKKGVQHQLFCKSDSGYEYLDFEFTVMSKKYEGKNIWQNYMLAFNGAPTDKSSTAIGISMRTLRAVVEAHRRIHPKDATPTAVQGRILTDFSDLNKMMFPILVGVEWSKPKDGKRYLNNTIKKIITPDDERFAKVYETSEMGIYSDKPLPPEPGTPAEGSAKPAWAAPAAGAAAPAAPAQATLPGAGATAKPPWAK